LINICFDEDKYYASYSFTVTETNKDRILKLREIEKVFMIKGGKEEFRFTHKSLKTDKKF
jgi:hypothetical protein